MSYFFGAGLFDKYKVSRRDGKEVEWCFVLEGNDPKAWPALLAYADAVEDAEEDDLLALQLRAKVRRYQSRVS